MSHLENHPHAFVKDGLVVNVAVFESHDADLLNVFAVESGCEIICCCDNGEASVGYTWDGTQFINPKALPPKTLP